LDLSSHRQKKLTEAWCALLPELPDVKTLWFNSRVNQPLFEAACEMENLEGLYVKWSGIKSIASLPKLKKLKYLHIGSSAQVESMEPLREMTGLQALEIENFKKIRKLDPIAELTQHLRQHLDDPGGREPGAFAQVNQPEIPVFDRAAFAGQDAAPDRGDQIAGDAAHGLVVEGRGIRVSAR
jgi:hypothetical protein